MKGSPPYRGGRGEPSQTTAWFLDGGSRVPHDLPSRSRALKCSHPPVRRTRVVRAEVIRKWGGFYEGNRCLYAEDAFLWLKVLLNESVGFTLEPQVRIHVEAASLSKNLLRARPLEPFLETPEEIESACPEDLRGLLGRLLTTRAFKTACVWGVWGQWREARELRRRFRGPHDSQLP